MVGSVGTGVVADTGRNAEAARTEGDDMSGNDTGGSDAGSEGGSGMIGPVQPSAALVALREARLVMALSVQVAMAKLSMAA